MKRIAVILFVCVLLLALAGCAAPSPAETSAPPADTPRPDPNTEMVKAGEKFSILEKGNETTGFKWQATVEDESIVEFVSYEYDPDDTDLIGAGGWTKLRFKALKKGETTILLEHRRSDRVAETKTITVIVE